MYFKGTHFTFVICEKTERRMKSNQGQQGRGVCIMKNQRHPQTFASFLKLLYKKSTQVPAS